MTTIGTIVPKSEEGKIRKAEVKGKAPRYKYIEMDWGEDRLDWLGLTIIDHSVAKGVGLSSLDIDELCEILRKGQRLINEALEEKFAVFIKGSFYCPMCYGTLNALVGVFGREVCRECKIILITNPKDDRFDKDHEWKYLGTKNGCEIYGNDDVSTKDTPI